MLVSEAETVLMVTPPIPKLTSNSMVGFVSEYADVEKTPLPKLLSRDLIEPRVPMLVKPLTWNIAETSSSTSIVNAPIPLSIRSFAFSVIGFPVKLSTIWPTHRAISSRAISASP